MTYGIIPIGGKGKRLGLPFSKEMLPQKGYNFYNPILDHMVSKMTDAGVDKIVFVHGEVFKSDVLMHYPDTKSLFLHVSQSTPSFSGSLKDGYLALKANDDDRIIFGLPDSIFEGNLFVETLKHSGIVCGLFKTLDGTKVDRLSAINNCGNQFFHVKSVFGYPATEWFWGVLKFDGADLKTMIGHGMFEKHTEIGHIINCYDKKMVRGGSYLDLGTWDNLNEYWSSHG